MLASRDLPQEMLYDLPPEPAQNPLPHTWSETLTELFDKHQDDDVTFAGDKTSFHRKSVASSTTTLVHRPKTPRPAAGLNHESDSSSDEDGFAMVYRPKSMVPSTPDEPMSSPELLPSVPLDVLAATGSDYPSDDDWSMV